MFKLPRLAWHLRLWLLPTLWLGVVFAALGCNLSATHAPTLQPQAATPTLTLPPYLTPTTTRAAGSVDVLTIDPGLSAMIDQVESDSLMMTLNALIDMHSRHVLSQPTEKIRGIGAARDWLIERFKLIADENPQQNLQVWTQPFQYNWNGYTINADNVIAVLQGSDIGAGVYIVGSHYDTITTDFTNGQAYSPGANDNASGVAALVELARVLAKQQLRATIIFVAFAAEETGRQGSLAFVKDYVQSQHIDVRGMINLDIIGSEMGANGTIDRRTLRLFSAEPNDSSSRQFARQVALFIKMYRNDVDAILQSAEERSGRWGDHQSFRAAGYASMRFIQGLEDLSRQHTPRDTIDNVQPGYLMKMTRAVLVALAAMAGGPPAPADLSLRSAVDKPDEYTLVWTAVPEASEYLVLLRESSSLFYDEIITVKASSSPELTRTDFNRYTTVAIASVDENGRPGGLTHEIPLASLRR